MKKILLSLSLASSLFAANVQINEAPKASGRVLANEQNKILSYQDSIKEVKKSVVNISTSRTITRQNRPSPLDDFFNDPYFKHFFDIPGQRKGKQKETISSLGSGVIISKDGYIITNNHVIEDADEISVSLAGSDKEYKAKLIGKDPKTDLAVIKIEATNLSEAKFANSDDLMEGDVVFALGNPFGVGFSVTSGIISALNKDNIGLNQYENFIQTDASINPGNSGGALVDSRGALVGINSAILSRSGGNNGIGFAIPSNMVENVAKKLIEKGKIERGYLGVSIATLQNETKSAYKNQEGALITEVQPNSAASIAGLKRGDLVIQVNKKMIKSANDLKNYIGSLEPNEKVMLTYERDGEIKEVSVVVKGDANLNEIAQSGGVIDGLSLKNMDATFKAQYGIPQNINGVFIESVDENSKAYEIGIREGDIIIALEQNEIKSVQEFQTVYKNLKNKNQVKVWINRGGAVLLVVLKK